MNRSELAKKMRDSLFSLEEQSAENLKLMTQAVGLLLTQIGDQAFDDRRTEIRGFGSFQKRVWENRFSRNPKTGESSRMGSQFTLHFRPGKDLRNRVKKK